MPGANSENIRHNDVYKEQKVPLGTVYPYIKYL